jgi:hypothetical protein
MAEGVHGHMYSPENRRAAFAFMDRFSGMPARSTLDAVQILEAAALRATPTGQVRVDLGGRSLPEVIRDERRAHPPAARNLADLYRGEGAPPVARWKLVPKGPEPASGVIAWEAAGTAKVGDVRIDRYRLHHGERLVIPLLHIHHEAGPRGRAVLTLALEGKVGVADWPAVVHRLDAGEEVLSFDLRAVGENRMRYRAASGDDPTLAEADEAQAYFNPLSGVLANHVYNALLVGRPYFLEMIEDIEIVTRFARERLGATGIALAPSLDAALLADVAAASLTSVAVAPSSPSPTFAWREAVEHLREVWPIQYLLPGAALWDEVPPSAR